MASLHQSFRYHVHGFDADQDDAGAAKVLETQYWPYNAFDSSVILLDNVVQVLRLSNFDRCLTLEIDYV
jgi:hypothetical protein